MERTTDMRRAVREAFDVIEDAYMGNREAWAILQSSAAPPPEPAVLVVRDNLARWMWYLMSQMTGIDVSACGELTERQWFRIMATADFLVGMELEVRVLEPDEEVNG